MFNQFHFYGIGKNLSQNGGFFFFTKKGDFSTIEIRALKRSRPIIRAGYRL